MTHVSQMYTKVFTISSPTLTNEGSFYLTEDVNNGKDQKRQKMARLGSSHVLVTVDILSAVV
jgi:hypothetical protein